MWLSKSGFLASLLCFTLIRESAIASCDCDQCGTFTVDCSDGSSNTGDSVCLSSNAVISNNCGNGDYTGQFISNGYNVTFNDSSGGGASDSDYLWLSNSSNDFSGSTIHLEAGGIRIGTSTGDSTISGCSIIEFNEAGGNNVFLSAPYGGTLSADIVIGNVTGSIFGSTSSNFLELAGNISGTSSGEDLLLYDNILLYPYAAATGSGSIGNGGGTLQIYNQAAFGSNAFDFLAPVGSPQSAILQFLATNDPSIDPSTSSITSNMVFNYSGDPWSGTIDTNSYTIEWSGDIEASSGSGSILGVMDSSGTGDGLLWLSGTSNSSYVDYYLYSGNFIPTTGATLDNNIIFVGSGTIPPTLLAYGGIYAGDFAAYGTGTIEGAAGAPSIKGQLTESNGTLFIINSAGGASSISIGNAPDYTGTLQIGLDYNGVSTQDEVAVNLWSDLFSGGLVIGQKGVVNYIYGTSNSSLKSSNGDVVLRGIANGGTLDPAFTTGSTINFYSDGSGPNANPNLTMFSSITGNMIINVKTYTDTSTYYVNLYTDGNNITGCVNIYSGCSINLGTSGTLTLVYSSEGSTGATPQILGDITGAGYIVVEASTPFGSSSSSYPTNSFNSLTLTSGILTVYNPASLGSGSGTLIGNGGELNARVAMTLANPWILKALGTSTAAIAFEGGSTPSFTITGSITTAASSGTTAMLSSENTSDVSFTPSSMTMATGVTLATNGNSITTGTITGSGSIALGSVVSSHSSVDDTLTITGTCSYSGNITDNTGGKGSVVIEGSVTLLGNNSFSNGLTISSGGNLTISSASNLGNSSGTIIANGGILTNDGTTGISVSNPWSFGTTIPAITFEGGGSSNPTVITGAIKGKGSVVVDGTVSLFGANTFSDGLYLASAGNLTINASDNLGSSSGTIYFQGGELTTVLSAVTGASASIGTSSNNTLNFTGGTNTVFNIANTMTFTLLGSGATTGSGTIEITKEGLGILYINDVDSFVEGDTYDLTVSEGGLTVDTDPVTVSSATPFLNDGVLRGREDSFFALADASYTNWNVTNVVPVPLPVINVTVESGAFLTGLGAVTTIDIKSGGYLIPGDVKPGVFAVKDTALFEEGSIYILRTDGSSFSLLDVSNGDVVMESNVRAFLAPVPGNYTGSRFLVVDTRSLVGRFHDLLVPASYFLETALEYSLPNQIILSSAPRSVFELVAVGNANAVAVSNAIDTGITWNRTNVFYEVPSLSPSSPNLPVLERVLETLHPFTTVEEMTEAANQLQPAFLKGFTVVQESNISKVQDTLDLRLKYVLDTKSCYTFEDQENCCKKDEKPIHSWIGGMGNVLAQDSITFADSPQVGYQSKMGGFAAGVDGHFKAFYLGAIGGYTTSYIKWRGHQGTGNINTGYAGIYLSAIGDMFYGNLSLIGGFSDFSGRRHIKYPGVDLTAKGNHAGRQLLSHADTGINWNIKGFTIRPFDSFDYITGTETSYIEQGVGQWGLTLNKTNAILLKNELGLELTTCLCFFNMKWVLSPKASWIREVRVKGDSYIASFTDAAVANAPFTVTGYFPNRSLFSPGISLTGSLCQDRLSVELSYKGEFTHGYSDHSYVGEVRYGF